MGKLSNSNFFTSLPLDAQAFLDWNWQQISPFFDELLQRQLHAQNIEQWLFDWTRLSDLMIEAHARRSLAVSMNSSDSQAEFAYNTYLDEIYPASQAANQRLKEKLLTSQLEPPGFEVPLRKMRTEAALFCEENIPLLAQEHKLVSQYNKIIGEQTITWNGEELTLQQLRRIHQNPQRSIRERAWTVASERQLADRAALNQLWSKFLGLRTRLGKQAGENAYFEYRWKQLLRLDYTPQDAKRFQKAILEAAVPAATRVYEKHRRLMRYDALRPWDLDLDLYPLHFPSLPSYGDTHKLADGVQTIFDNLDAQLGDYFRRMREHGLLSLDNQKGKAPGAFCTGFPATGMPFIFMNAVGVSGDVRTLLHESGHAFHNYERFKLPFSQQRNPGLEFAEVASMAIELLAAPFMASSGIFLTDDAARFRIAHLEHILVFWPYMAVVDAFQHWVYEHQDQSNKSKNCDACWLDLWDEYIPGVNWAGFEESAKTGWLRKQHIFRAPLYYLEYGLAQLGAVLVWQKALSDPDQALRDYRYALGLGGTVTLPDLYKAAGARLAFDTETLSEAVALVEGVMMQVEASLSEPEERRNPTVKGIFVPFKQS
ncbi:MAG TPA: M3 family oligoendopeptidase [Anaerolineales bacterium]|nr:M3 family oligoendopeptidase [Anaerolineales bacterium]